MDIDQYNIVWTTQSRNSSESMPCGGHDLGLNVWVEDGDILFYIDRGGHFDEHNYMLKPGRVRLRLSPNPLASGGEFRQELDLARGCVVISGAHEGRSVSVEIWVEVERPVVHVETSSTHPLGLDVSYENWRTQERLATAMERWANLGIGWGNPDLIPVIMYPDTIEAEVDHVVFYHRNRNDDLIFDKEVVQQHLEPIADDLWNPLRDLTFGGQLTGTNLRYVGSRDATGRHTPYTLWLYRSESQSRTHHVQVTMHAAQTDSVDDWRRDLLAVTQAESPTREEARQTALAYWREFWQRSHIWVNPDSCDPADPAWQVGRNYTLFRYQLGCNPHGTCPTKFNGGLFSFGGQCFDDWQAEDGTPDLRRWGGGAAVAQNQRLVYFPMLKSGDFDLLQPQLDFYERARGNAERRTQHYWGHAGASFTEQMEHFGLPCAEIYEHFWGDRGVQPRPETADSDPGELRQSYCSDQYDTALEFCLMALQSYSYSGRDISSYLPLIDSCITFFDEHYQFQHRKRTGQPLGDDGKLVIYPGTACETYKKARNSMPSIAGLTAVLQALLNLPEALLESSQREHYKDILKRVPGLPARELDGRTIFAPAESWEYATNCEQPQMYAVFPYELCGLGRANLQMAIDTWQYDPLSLERRGHISWHQDGIFAARMGLTDEAAEIAIKKLADSERRFPTFWGPGHDWTPDHNWGGSGMIGLQDMLLQTCDNTIYVLPAWPTEWSVDFRLHAPGQTVVELAASDGVVTRLDITPASRQAYVIIPTGWTLSDNVSRSENIVLSQATTVRPGSTRSSANCN